MGAFVKLVAWFMGPADASAYDSAQAFAAADVFGGQMGPQSRFVIALWFARTDQHKFCRDFIERVHPHVWARRRIIEPKRAHGAPFWVGRLN